jgi:hypothetical protein
LERLFHSNQQAPLSREGSVLKITTQEQLYIKLLQNEKTPPKKIPKEFLRDFQFCKAVLEKIGIGLFSEEQQREMNLQAVEIHLHSSRWIRLQYDIPKITKLVPENVLGDLDLLNSQIRELTQVRSVVGYLYLVNSQIRELTQLGSVGGHLNLNYSQIKELPQLKSVGRKIFVNKEDLQRWEDYFTQTNRPHLTEKVVAI